MLNVTESRFKRIITKRRVYLVWKTAPTYVLNKHYYSMSHVAKSDGNFRVKDVIQGSFLSKSGGDERARTLFFHFFLWRIDGKGSVYNNFTPFNRKKIRDIKRVWLRVFGTFCAGVILSKLWFIHASFAIYLLRYYMDWLLKYQKRKNHQ